MPSTARTSLPDQKVRKILTRPSVSMAKGIRLWRRAKTPTAVPSVMGECGSTRTSTSGTFAVISIRGCRLAQMPLRRNYVPQDLEPILKRNRFEGSVVVQANTILDETRWLLELASEHEFIRGVVGWVDLTNPRRGAALDEFQRHPKFKGVRHLVHDEPDMNWLSRANVIAGLRELARRGIPYDLLLRPEHLKIVPGVAEKVPGCRRWCRPHRETADRRGTPKWVGRRHDGGGENPERLLQALRHDHRSRSPRLESRTFAAVCRPRAEPVRAGPADVRQRLAGLHAHAARGKKRWRRSHRQSVPNPWRRGRSCSAARRLSSTGSVSVFGGTA